MTCFKLESVVRRFTSTKKVGLNVLKLTENLPAWPIFDAVELRETGGEPGVI